MSNISASISLPRFLLAVVAVALLVAACGGGSDGDPADSSATTLPPPTQAPDSPPTNDVPPDENAGYRPPSPDPADSAPNEDVASPPSLFVQLHNNRIRVDTTVDVSVRGNTAEDDRALANAETDAQPSSIEFVLADGDPITLLLEKIERPTTGIPTTWRTTIEFPQPGDWQSTIIRGDGSRTEGPAVLVEPESELLRPFTPLDSRSIRIAAFDPGDASARIVTDASSTAIGWLSDPDRILFTNLSDDELWVITVDPQTGAFDKLLPLDGNSGRIDASPDGTHFLLRDTLYGPDVDEMSTVKLVDAASRAITTVYENRGTPSLNVAWAPDSQHFILLSNRAKLYDADGTLLADPSIGLRRCAGIRWAPDSSFALIGPTENGEIFRLDPTTGTLVTLLAADDVEASTGSLSASIAISPDSRRIALSWRVAGSADWRLAVVRAGSTHATLLATSPAFILPSDDEDFPRTWLFGLSWSPNGQRLAFTTIDPSTESANAGISLFDVDAGTARALERSDTAPPPSRTPPTWSADGSQLLATHRGCVYACDGPSWGSVFYDAASGSILLDQEGLFNAATDGQGLQFLRTPDGLFSGFDLTNPLLAIPGMTYRVTTSPSGATAAAVISQAGSTTVRYAVHPDGTGQEALAVESPDKQPEGAVFNLDSPDGTRRAVLLLDGLHIREPDGSLTKISDVSVQLKTVYWSPDGSQIVYQAAESDHLGDFIVVNTDGSGAYKLVDANQTSQLLGWDADGRIVYVHFPGI